MKLRDKLLEDIVSEFEDLAWSTLDAEYVPEDPENWKLDGIPLPHEDVFELFFAWDKHGVMAVSGGYYDQPVQWRRAMRILRKLYGTKAAEVKRALILRNQQRGLNGSSS
jgi:hypothetical protein